MCAHVKHSRDKTIDLKLSRASSSSKINSACCFWLWLLPLLLLFRFPFLLPVDSQFWFVLAKLKFLAISCLLLSPFRSSSSSFLLKFDLWDWLSVLHVLLLETNRPCKRLPNFGDLVNMSSWDFVLLCKLASSLDLNGRLLLSEPGPKLQSDLLEKTFAKGLSWYDCWKFGGGWLVSILTVIHFKIKIR